MNETSMLIGSLSSDLFRIANLTYSGAILSSRKFAKEAKRWANPLLNKPIPQYLKNIAREIDESDINIDKKKAEKYLMYAVLLQNYVLCQLKNRSLTPAKN